MRYTFEKLNYVNAIPGQSDFVTSFMFAISVTQTKKKFPISVTQKKKKQYIYQSNSFTTPLSNYNLPLKRKRRKDKKRKMWKGDFLCVGTVLAVLNAS